MVVVVVLVVVVVAEVVVIEVVVVVLVVVVVAEVVVIEVVVVVIEVVVVVAVANSHSLARSPLRSRGRRIFGRVERKTWCTYATIDALGIHMHQEDSWPTLAVERSSLISTVNGGTSQMVAIFSPAFFAAHLPTQRQGSP